MVAVFFGYALAQVEILQKNKITEFIAYHSKTKMPGGLVKLSFESQCCSSSRALVFKGQEVKFGPSRVSDDPATVMLVVHWDLILPEKF